MPTPPISFRPSERKLLLSPLSLCYLLNFITMELSQNAAILRRTAIWAIFIFAVALSCVFLYRASDSMPFRLPRESLVFTNLNDDSYLSEEHSLEKVLKDASMPDKTVILTTLNGAWAGPNSVVDLFLESFRIGERTRRLLNHLVIVSFDRKAFSCCQAVHSHCFPLVTQGADFSREAYFMTPDYLDMMWRRIDFLRSVLQMGYNFVFTDADVMWFRDPFPEFYPDADFQIACDHYSGSADDPVNNIPNGGFKFVRSNSRSIEFYKFWYTSHGTYPGLHDQDVLNRIKNHSFIRDIGMKMKFLDTTLFGGFCEPSRELDRVCTMHANCCLGLDSKLHDLRILIDDWKKYLSLPLSSKPFEFSWRVPQNCSLDSLRVRNVDDDDTPTSNR